MYPCQRVTTRRYGDLIPAGMIGVSGKRLGGVSTVNELLGGESVYLYIYGGKIGGTPSFWICYFSLLECIFII